MSLNASQSRIWPRIFAAMGDGHRKDILPPQRNLSELDSATAEGTRTETKYMTAERKLQTEDRHTQQVSHQSSTLPLDPSKEPNSYNERVIAEALKDINSEIDTLQSLYNSQWFADKRMASNRSNLPQDMGNNESDNTNKSHVFQNESHSSNETNMNISDINNSVMPELSTSLSKCVVQHKESEVNITNFSSSNKKVSKSFKSQAVSDKKIYKTSEIEPQTIKRLNTLSDIERRAFKKSVTATTKVSQEKRVQRGSSQCHSPTQISSVSPVQHQREGNEVPSDVDVFINALTETERQTFKDAINAMKEETEKEERSIAKESSKSGLSRKATSLRSSKEPKKSQKPALRSLSRPQSSSEILHYTESNRVGIEVANIVHSQSSLYKQPLVQRVSSIQTSKLRKTPEETQIRRDLTTTKKVGSHRTLKSHSSSKTPVSDIKNGSFPQGFVKSVPLKAEVIEIKPSVPLVTRHSVPKKVPTKSPFQKIGHEIYRPSTK